MKKGGDTPQTHPSEKPHGHNLKKEARRKFVCKDASVPFFLSDSPTLIFRQTLIHGIFYTSSHSSSNPCHRPGCRSCHLGRHQPSGRLRQRQSGCQVPGHQAAHGRRRRGVYWYRSCPPSVHTFRIGILVIVISPFM